MNLLIDGYNLLHATDLFGAGDSAGTLEGSREALLAFLSASLTASERRRATIVFDASDAPPGLPATISHESITVHFARDYPDADAMIEALIESGPRGKGLLVVSSDRRVQRAARSHGARWQEAAAWYYELRSRGSATGGEDLDKGSAAVGDTQYWAEKFTDEATLNALQEDQRRAEASPPPAPKQNKPKSAKPRTSKQPKQPFGEGIFEGFPPGYAEELAQKLDDGNDSANDDADDNRPAPEA